MTKTQVNQILIATASTVLAGLILDYFKKQNQPPPPVVDDQPFYKEWF